MLVAFITEVENIIFKNIYTLKKNIDIEQYFALTFLNILFIQGHIQQMVKNALKDVIIPKPKDKSKN